MTDLLTSIKPFKKSNNTHLADYKTSDMGGPGRSYHVHHVQLVYMGTGDAAANGAVMTLLLVALTSLSPSSVS